MRALITGSSGQIGTNLGLRLLDLGHEVVGIDVRDNTWTDRIEMIRVDLTRPYAEVREALAAAVALDGFDIVIHLAAHAKVHELVRRPDRALENVVMVHNALELTRELGLPIVFGSSREVYGNLDQPPPTSEDAARFQSAASPYAASKVAGEAFVYSYARCYDLPYLVFRFSNVYGRFDNDIERMERVIPLFVRRIAEGDPIVVFGREKQLDFTYVDDCVEGLRRGIEHLLAGGASATVNLAYGEGHGLLDLVEYISAAVGREPDVTVEETQAGEVSRYIADLTVARSLLGYAPTVALPEGIRRAVEWSRAFEAERLAGTTPRGA